MTSTFAQSVVDTIDDAIDTISGSVDRMERVIAQLRRGTNAGVAHQLDLAEVVTMGPTISYGNMLDDLASRGIQSVMNESKLRAQRGTSKHGGINVKPDVVLLAQAADFAYGIDSS